MTSNHVGAGGTYYERGPGAFIGEVVGVAEFCGFRYGGGGVAVHFQRLAATRRPKPTPPAIGLDLSATPANVVTVLFWRD